nr:MAG TPA_asm: hypothetical protein [Bacteriophage sp.]
MLRWLRSFVLQECFFTSSLNSLYNYSVNVYSILPGIVKVL